MITNKKIGLILGGENYLENQISLKAGEYIFNFFKENLDFKKIILNKEEDIEKEKTGIDVVFIVTNGPFGESGKLQRELNFLKIPYFWSFSTITSFLFNKFATLKVLKHMGFNVPYTILINKKSWVNEKENILKNIFFYIKKPWVLKPNNSSLSFGIKIAQNKEEVANFLDFLFLKFNEVLVQEFIYGKEIVSTVIDYGDNISAFSLMPVEIVPLNRKFFGEEEKLNFNLHLEFIPPRIPIPYIQEIRRKSVFIHRNFHLRHFSKIDFILNSKDKKLYILEINTIPDLRENSIFLKQLENYGLEFAKFLDNVLKSS